MPATLADSMHKPIASIIADELPELVTIRHDLHRHPELSFKESRTSGVVQRELAALNIEHKPGLGGGTGVIAYLPATLPHGNDRPAIALRADMDALPILEQSGKPYASVSPGVMHACGHDGHTTILLGAARVLMSVPRPRPVLLVFQPAEEGGGGADVMCKEGALAGKSKGGLGNPVEKIFGLHGWPQLPLGRMASRVGPLLAAVDDIEVTVRGTQSHGAYPHFGRDPIVTTAHIITALQSIASRNVGPLDSVVVTIGAIHAGTANNIIPEAVHFIGTIRTLKDTTKAVARERFVSIVEGVAKSMGCHAEVRYTDSYPVTVNDREATEDFFTVADAVAGRDKVDRLENPTMGGEDFSYYGRHVKAAFFYLGLCPPTLPPGIASFPTLHQPNFDFNDDAIPMGVETFVRLATTV
ncbi:MAG: amidohydrolase [Phycisphaerales bacterium]|nr:MAG: amidohydrolase [Phycisphaerales bacterium]